MAIPTTGPFTSEQVRSEFGLSFPMTSAQVASAAGLTTPWHSDDLRGKSGVDNSINPISWDTLYISVSYTNGMSSSQNYSSNSPRTITGISGPVVLRFNAINMIGDAGITISASVNNGQQVDVCRYATTATTPTYPNKITVKNNDTLFFYIYVYGDFATSRNRFVNQMRNFNLEVINESDNNALVSLLLCEGRHSDTYSGDGGGGPIDI